MMSEAFEPYCTEGCGRRATVEVPCGMVGDTPVTEWRCSACEPPRFWVRGSSRAVSKLLKQLGVGRDS